MRRRIEIKAEERYGHLTVLAEGAPKRTRTGVKRMIRVRCACGHESEVQLNNLRAKNTTSCGRWGCEAASAKRWGNMRAPKEGSNQRECLRAYRRGARSRGLSFELTEEQFLTLTQSDCYYCGAAPSNVFNLKKSGTDTPRCGAAFIYSGIDRVDSTRGYEVSNTVACCRTCNVAKSDMTQQDFYAWVERVHNHPRR